MRPWRGSRTTDGALTLICFSVFIAAVRAFTAVSRATLSCRIISTAPSAGLWRRGRLARQHRSGGGLGVDPVGLAGDAAQAPVRSIHFHNTMPRSADRTRKAHAIAAGAFDAERLDPPVGLGPREEGLIAA